MIPEYLSIDQFFRLYYDLSTPGAAVLIMTHEQPPLLRAYGSSDIFTGIDASFRLASLSKQFTAFGVAILVEEGKLSFEDRAALHLPTLPAYASEVQLKHLLSHTSGLIDYEDMIPPAQTRQVSDADVLSLITSAKALYFPPGSRYRYSNTAYCLLALIIEKASGQSFATFLRERIFKALGMQNTAASPDVPKRVYGHTCNRPPAVQGDGRRVRDGIESTDQSVTSATLGDGGIYSSVSDLHRWLTHLASLVPPSQPSSVLPTSLSAGRPKLGVSQDNFAKYFLTPFLLADGTPSPYSFGFFVDRDAASNLRLTHHGESTGFTNAILFYPHLRYSVVILTNRTVTMEWELERECKRGPEGDEPWNIAQKIAKPYLDLRSQNKFLYYI